MDSEYYTQVLKSALLHVANTPFSNDWMLQHDNAAVHTSHPTLHYFDMHGIDVLN